MARFALPDVDPDRDIDVSTRPGLIIVEARHPIAGGPGIYHLLTSHVYLPAGADDRDVQAIYENGTLDVTIGLGSQPGLANSRC